MLNSSFGPSQLIVIQPGHMPRLDALRTLAVLLVIVYHWFPTGEGINRPPNRLGISLTLGYWSHRLFSLAVLLAVASVSWYAFEKPINELKRYFSYKGETTKGILRAEKA